MPPKKTKNDSKIDSKKESKKTSKKTSKPKKEPKPKKTSKPKKESTSKKTSKPKKESKSKKTSKKFLETTEETTEDSFNESSEKESQEEVYSEDLNIGSETELKDCELEDSVDDDDFLDGDESSEINENSEVKFVLGDDRKTNPRLTRYEMVRILGERIKQLTMGAKPLVKNVQDITYDQIALEELKLNMIPFKIKRPLPNNKVEIWDINELNKKHLTSLLN